MNPLVSVVCLCHNQASFVAEAIQSVLAQTYTPIQLIVVDDGSVDDSKAKINQSCGSVNEASVIFIPQSIGNCAAFNKALPLVKGEFVVDFAADDVMMPDRIAKQVRKFLSSDSDVGVVFTDALFIDSDGKALETHYGALKRKRLFDGIPEGNVYPYLLSRYYVCSPTMLVRTSVMRELGGYDETLSYEDFDFWVRSSRICKYAYLDDVLTKVRRSKRSMSTGWYQQGDKQLYSTYLVCKKAMVLNRTEEDRLALISRLQFEIRQAVFSENVNEALLFYNLLRELKKPSALYKVLMLLNSLRLPLSFVRRWYHQLRYH